MPGRRWADEVEAEGAGGRKGASIRPVSAPLGHEPLSRDRPFVQCADCGASYYLNTRGKPHRFCRDCFATWSLQRRRTKPSKRTTTTSPASSTRTGTSDATEEDAGRGCQPLPARPGDDPRTLPTSQSGPVGGLRACGVSRRGCPRGPDRRARATARERSLVVAVHPPPGHSARSQRRRRTLSVRSCTSLYLVRIDNGEAY